MSDALINSLCSVVAQHLDDLDASVWRQACELVAQAYWDDDDHDDEHPLS